jgi:hypothetical protein
MSIWTLPFIFQGIAMFVDEFYFHHKRGLARWEKIGHPLDTLTVLICLSFLVFFEPNEMNIKIYAALALFSCVFVTKDEFVHKDLCESAEMWLHALLFVLHPLILGSAAWPWIQGQEMGFIKIQAGIAGCFMLYQIIYWGLRHESSQQ